MILRVRILALSVPISNLSGTLPEDTGDGFRFVFATVVTGLSRFVHARAVPIAELQGTM